MNDDWTRENGKELLWWAENASGRIFFTSPMSPLPAGYVRKSTTSPKEMDRLFNKMHEQEREQNERMIEKIYNQGRWYYDKCRSELKRRLTLQGTSNAERNIIRAALKLMDEKDSKMQENHIYGVSAMQESEKPIEAPRKKVTVN